MWILKCGISEKPDPYQEAILKIYPLPRDFWLKETFHQEDEVLPVCLPGQSVEKGGDEGPF
jgi:hypothetical protein